MEQIKQTFENSVGKKPLMTATSLQTFDNGSANTMPDSYLAMMILIVADSFYLSSAQPTREEIGKRAETWARVLWDVLPENRLQECFDRAFRDRESKGFPVSAYDLNDAWNVIQTEDTEILQKQREAVREANPIENCDMRQQHISDIGEIEILYGGPGGTEETVPCPFCRPKANQDAYRNLAERMKEGRK